MAKELFELLHILHTGDRHILRLSRGETLLQISIRIVVKANNFIDTQLNVRVIFQFDEAFRIEIKVNKRIAPINRHGIDLERLHDFLGRVAGMGAILKRDIEFVFPDKRQFIGNALRFANIVQKPSAARDGLVFAQFTKEQLPNRMGASVVGHDKRAKLAIEQTIGRCGRGLHRFVDVIKSIQGNARITIAEREVVEPDGIIKIVEVGTEILFIELNLDAVIIERIMPEDMSEQIFRLIRQLHVVIFRERLVDVMLPCLKTRPAIRNFDSNRSLAIVT